MRKKKRKNRREKRLFENALCRSCVEKLAEMMKLSYPIRRTSPMLLLSHVGPKSLQAREPSVQAFASFQGHEKSIQ